MDCNPARLLCPWDSPGKKTAVGCHALLQGSSRPRDRTWVSPIGGEFYPTLSTCEIFPLQVSLSYEVLDGFVLTGQDARD